jgi:hypothetical protein
MFQITPTNFKARTGNRKTPRELLVNKMSGEKKNLIKKMSGEEKKKNTHNTQTKVEKVATPQTYGTVGR